MNLSQLNEILRGLTPAAKKAKAKAQKKGKVVGKRSLVKLTVRTGSAAKQEISKP